MIMAMVVMIIQHLEGMWLAIALGGDNPGHHVHKQLDRDHEIS